MMDHIPIQFLLDRVTATQSSKPIQALNAARDLCFTLTSEGTTSGGTVIIEESDLLSYTGTWSQLYSQAASGLSGDAKLCIHVRIGAGMWCRVRISATITGGGTITATVTGS